MFCCCALAGTSACESCTNRINEQGRTFSTTFSTPLTYKFQKKAKPIIQYWCGECEAVVNKYQNYCSNCGSYIEWDLDSEKLDF